MLIVTPAALVGQWRDELRDKFDLDADIFDADSVDELAQRLPAAANPWHYGNRVITSLDYAKQDRVWRVLKGVKWDLVIFDEAHYLAESGSVAHPVRTARSRFAAGLVELAAHRGCRQSKCCPLRGRRKRAEFVRSGPSVRFT